MRAPLLPWLAAIIPLVACEPPLSSTRQALLNDSSLAISDSHSLVKRAPVGPASEWVWQACGCRGQKLQLLNMLNPQEAQRFGTPLNSPWTGTLVNELALWGYVDKSENRDIKDQCDFTMKPMFETALKALGISARSASDGGPNKCFSYVHRDGPAVLRPPNGELPTRPNQRYVVDGRTYRITNAYFTIGINAQDGVIYLLDRLSPASAAKSLWKIPGTAQPPKNELPALGSSSDIAWGLWERMSPGNLANINYIFSHTIVNTETCAIVMRATQGRALLPWPGEVFVAGAGQAYWALLGSPNGIAVGYLLGQHKPQFGHNRYVSAIHVFQGGPVMMGSAFPFLCFVVRPAPYPPPPPPSEIQMRDDAPKKHVAVSVNEGRVLKLSEDGKSMVRSHKVWTQPS